VLGVTLPRQLLSGDWPNREPKPELYRFLCCKYRGNNPFVTRHRQELEAYRARHFAEPNMYQTPMERMIAEDIKQMGPTVRIHPIIQPFFSMSMNL